MPTHSNMERALFGSALLLMLGWAATSADAAELTAAEARGKQIYTNGTSPSGADISAHMGVGGFPLPASVMPCASCHGPDGRGRPEGGVIPSDVTWGYLTRSYGHEHSYGREHPAYTEATVARAISHGLDPAGGRLEIAMPLYTMEPDDLDALIAYMKRIETDYDPGITPDSIRLATLLPLSGRMAPLGSAMRAVLDAYVDDLNAAGGINGRTIELDVVPFGQSPEQALANLDTAIARTGTFALLSPYSIGIETELARFAEEALLPLIAPYTLQPPARSALDRYTFYLFSGDEQQVRILVETVAEQHADQDPGLVVTGADSDAVRTLAKALTKQIERRDWRAPATLYYTAGDFDAPGLAGQLRAADTGAVFFFGAPTELDALLAEFVNDETVPLLLVPASRVARSLFEAPAIFDGRILTAYPRSPADVTAAGKSAYAALRENHELSGEYASAQLAVLAAVTMLDEALKRAGKHLSRESLISALEGLHEYETGLAPPLTFSLNRRIGALGAQVVRLDLGRATFVPEGEWRNLK
ncbi:MAG: ABC transporter substrate-binding protein [Gammaproteobacteria bacterium]|nr:ABC transporter substrate-binding protein [Gammaproteobacteria bacterium]MDH3363159.1 ABC transporter substrate-binding protein [Gammaproteobacteria bacterium]MDH3482223.1 ABC transporter substrate-binding protein [Gammaproteobacteria bacterium]